MLNLKTTFLYLTLVCFSFGCDDMYQEKNKYVVLDVGSKDCIVDSMVLKHDTIRIYRSNRIADYTFIITVDSTPFTPIEVPVWVGKADSSKIIIENQKGDILLDKAVKNVYNK